MSLISNLIIFTKLLQMPYDVRCKQWSIWLEFSRENAIPFPFEVLQSAKKFNIPLPAIFIQLLKSYEQKLHKDNFQWISMKKAHLSMDPMTRIGQTLWYFLMVYNFNSIQQLINQRTSNDEAKTAVMQHLREVVDFLTKEMYSFKGTSENFKPIVKNYFIYILNHWQEWIIVEDLGLGITDIIQLNLESDGDQTGNPLSLFHQLMKKQRELTEKGKKTVPTTTKPSMSQEAERRAKEVEEANKNDKKITVTDTARILGLSRQRVHQYIQMGLLRFEKNNKSKKTWIPEEDVLRIQNQRVIILPQNKAFKRRKHPKQRKDEKGKS